MNQICRIACKKAGRTDFVRVDTIEAVQADSKLYAIHTADGEVHFCQARASSLEQVLGTEFLHINRGTWVRLNCIKKTERTDGLWKVTVDSGGVFFVSRRRWTVIAAALRSAFSLDYEDTNDSD